MLLEAEEVQKLDSHGIVNMPRRFGVGICCHTAVAGYIQTIASTQNHLSSTKSPHVALI